MQKFIDWFNNPDVKPSLVKSAIAHFWFVCIHPFDDGNGRIARALSDMVLSQIDKSKFRYFSVSRQICTDKKKYYKVLERVSRNDHDITEWIIWYLQCIIDAVKSADSVLSDILCKTVFWHTHSEVPMSKRQKDMLRIFLDGQQKLTVKNWSGNAKVSPDTAARDIDDLVQKGVLFPTKGQVRNVSYNFIYTNQSDFMQHFSNVAIENRDGNNYISTLFDNTEMLSEKIDDLDILRLRQDEINIEDLVWKYFAWKIEE
jgi:Fic family protein